MAHTDRIYSTWITVGKLKELLAGLNDDDELVPAKRGSSNRIILCSPGGKYLGYIDIQQEVVVYK